MHAVDSQSKDTSHELTKLADVVHKKVLEMTKKAAREKNSNRKFQELMLKELESVSEAI